MRIAPLLAALALAASCGWAAAQQAVPGEAPSAACTFDWPLAQEQAWFLAPGLPKIDSGGTLPPDAPGAELRLKPFSEAALPARPSREPKPGTYAGVLTIPTPSKPGLYQVTLSDEGWLDVAQNGEAPKKPLAHTGRRDCPGLRKSLRYQLSSNPVAVTVSNATSDTIKIAIAPAE